MTLIDAKNKRLPRTDHVEVLQIGLASSLQIKTKKKCEEILNHKGSVWGGGNLKEKFVNFRSFTANKIVNVFLNVLIYLHFYE